MDFAGARVYHLKDAINARFKLDAAPQELQLFRLDDIARTPLFRLDDIARAPSWWWSSQLQVRSQEYYAL